MKEFYSIKDNNIYITVKVVPNSSKSEIAGLYEGALKIKIKALAIENKANIELIKFLSKQLGIPKTNIIIKSGETSKIKNICLTNCPIEKFSSFCDTINLSN